MLPVIIIPAYNPIATFSKLIQSIRNKTSIPIIIIDDGSQPSIIIETEYSEIILLRNNNNQGKGYSLIKGFHYAYKMGYTHGITLDADSQHDPSLIPEFLSMDQNFSIICGKRDFNNTMPLLRRISNISTSKIISLITHTKLFDSQCGYRRYILHDICTKIFYEKGFQFETEVLLTLLRSGMTISHIDIPTIYTGERSYIDNFRDTLKFIKLIIRTLGKL